MLSVGRLEANKRVDLIVRALAHADRRVRLIVVGEGPLREPLERAAAEAGVADRVTWAGAIDERALVDLYAGALGVVFPPFDEDYGYVTLEAFLARKPVVTTTDAGRPAGIRRGRRQRSGDGAGAGSDRRSDRPACRRPPAARRRLATPATNASARSRGTAWWID